MSLALGIALSLTLSQPKPHWVSDLLAGYALEDDESHRTLCAYDAAKGYYLVRSAECDGAILTLMLTKDRHLIANQFGYKVPSLEGENGTDAIKNRKLSNLKSNPGVQIGDSESSVRKALGKPSKVEKTGNRKQFDTFKYQWESKVGERKMYRLQTYTFKEGKLIEIMLHRGLD